MNQFIKIYNLFTFQQKKSVFFLLLFVLIMSLLDTFGIASVMPIITVISDKSSIHDNAQLLLIFSFFNNYFQFNESEFLFLLVFSSITVITISTVFKAFVFSKITSFVEATQHSITLKLMFKIIGKEYKYFIVNNTSHLSNTILIQTSRFVGGIIRPFIFIMTYLITAIFIASFLFILNPYVAFLSFTFLTAIYILFYLLIRKKLLSYGSISLNSHRSLHQITAEILRGIKLIKLLPSNQCFHRDFIKYSSSYSYAQSKIQLSSILPNIVIEGVILVSLLSVFLVYLIHDSFETNTLLNEHLSLLAVYAFAVMRIRPALSQILSSASIYRSSVASIKQILDEFSDDSLIENKIYDRTEISFTSDITVTNLSYSYNRTDSFTLSNINFKLESNKFYSIVGKTGSGKSTLLDLLLGILDTEDDCIFVDNTPLNKFNNSSWHNLLSYVPQETFLIDGTVAENIAFGVDRKDIDYEKLSFVSKLSLIDDFIQNDLNDGFNSNIGEAGICISGGQRQRLGIARALYRNPKLLVLDEATSALDPVTEKNIYNNLLCLNQPLTIIMVTHRIRNAFKSDSILYMEDGCILFEGSYDDLHSRHEKFRAFVDLD